MTIREERPSGTDAIRAKAIVASLSAGQPSSEEVFAAFEELDALPVEVVRNVVGAWVGAAPDTDGLDDATRLALDLPFRPLRLRTLTMVKDADVLDLGPVAEEQLRLAGISFDGADLAPEERLDEEMEGNFAGALEHRVLSNAEQQPGQPLFDVLLYAGDAGVVFRAGTTELLGMISYGRVEMSDRRARAAIQEAIAAEVVSDAVPESLPETLPEPVAADAADDTDDADDVSHEEAPPVSVTTAKKKTTAKTAAPLAAPKKATAKKAAATKTTATKTPPKKTTAAKTTAAKTTAAKTTAAKTTAAKTTAAKTTAAKKTTAKKTTAKNAKKSSD